MECGVCERERERWLLSNTINNRNKKCDMVDCMRYTSILYDIRAWVPVSALAYYQHVSMSEAYQQHVSRVHPYT